MSADPTPSKACASCKVNKALDAFGSNRGRPDGRDVYCRDCSLEKNRQWRQQNPEKVAAKSHACKLRRYRMTVEQYEAMLAAQDGKCLICGSAPENGFLHVDHDHSCCGVVPRTCGRCVRGLLCQNCNQGIGRFREDPKLLLAAIDYLDTTRSGA